MAEQDIPDWLQALRPTEPPPAEPTMPSDIPDWLKELQPRELGPGAPVGDFPEPEALPEPETLPEPESTPEEVEPPSPPSEFELLRQKAASQAEFVEEDFQEESPLLQTLKRSAIVQLIGTLQPWQRFTVTLLLFLNIGTLGFFILLIMGRIYFGP